MTDVRREKHRRIISSKTVQVAVLAVICFVIFFPNSSYFDRSANSTGISTNTDWVQAEIQAEKFQRSEAKQPTDVEEWCTFVIVCGKGETDAVKEMRALLTSAMLLTSKPLHFVFLTDDESAKRLETMFDIDLHVSKRPVKVDIWTVPEKSVETFAATLDYNPRYHHSGIWGTLKLMLPWILQDVDKAVQVDTDMIFVDDPARLWDEFDNDDDGESSDWLYKMPLPSMEDPSKICSCVVLFNMARIREANTYPTLFQQALATQPKWKVNGIYNTPHGDQGLYWALAKMRNNLVAPLPKRWNADRCHDYYDTLKDAALTAPSMLHNNCATGLFKMEFGKAEIYYTFYENYKWHWLRGDPRKDYDVSVSTHVYEKDGIL